MTTRTHSVFFVICLAALLTLAVVGCASTPRNASANGDPVPQRSTATKAIGTAAIPQPQEGTESETVRAAATTAHYEVKCAQILLWYDNQHVMPSVMEHLWWRDHPSDYATLQLAVGSVRRIYPGTGRTPDERLSDAVHNAMKDVQDYLDNISGSDLKIRPDKNAYKPGGQGHGGSTAVLSVCSEYSHKSYRIQLTNPNTVVNVYPRVWILLRNTPVYP